MIEIKGGAIGSKRDFLGEFFGWFAWPYDPLGRIGSCPGVSGSLLTSWADGKSHGFGIGSHCGRPAIAKVFSQKLGRIEEVRSEK